MSKVPGPPDATATTASAQPSRRAMIGLAAVVMVIYAATGWWRDHQASLLGPEIAQLARAGDIRMLSSTTCGYCTQARQWFTAQQVPFQECFIERDADCATRYQATGARGTPTLLVRGQVQLGFSAPLLRDGLLAAAAAGPGG